MLNDIYTQLPQPNPTLSPIDVVKIQLDALQNNDLVPHNLGLCIAFEHTSLSHKKAIATVEQFKELLRTSFYRALIGFEWAELEQIRIAGQSAQQAVHLMRRDEVVSYLFLLSQQEQPPYVACWMTDALLLKD